MKKKEKQLGPGQQALSPQHTHQAPPPLTTQELLRWTLRLSGRGGTGCTSAEEGWCPAASLYKGRLRPTSEEGTWLISHSEAAAGLPPSLQSIPVLSFIHSTNSQG